MQFMSLAVIKMEGGTDHDLRILELTSEEEEQKSALAGVEPPKRENLKSADGDRKPLVEKDKNEKVGFVFCLLFNQPRSVWMVISPVPYRKGTTLQSHKEGLQWKEMRRKRRGRRKAPKTECPH